MWRLWIFPLLLLTLAACEPVAPAAPTVPPFPTMTPGRVVVGALPTAAVVPVDSLLANPATAVALANLPTATPDYTRCPAAGSPPLSGRPESAQAALNEIARFLSDGGSVAALDAGLRSWSALGDTGVVRADLDLTGEGVPDVLTTYLTQDEGGTLTIFTCADGRYAARYSHSSGGEIPTLLFAGDVNLDARPDVLFASRVCVSEDECSYRTNLVTWRGDLGRFVNLLRGGVTSDDPPALSDPDSDGISELVVRQTSLGTAQTGPMRTGVIIYDWSGAEYVRSIVQLDPPRFRIQVIHAADRAFARLVMDEAIPLYELALTSTTLADWIGGRETPNLQSYARYRLLLARAFQGAAESALAAYQAVVDAYPDPANQPIYAELAGIFWNSYQITNNLHSSCLEVQEMIGLRPEALDMLNRYGTRSPVYTAETVCPF